MDQPPIPNTPPENAAPNGFSWKTVINREFVTGAIVPVLIFTLFSVSKKTLYGAIFSGLWCLAMVGRNWIRERKLNALAVMAAAFSAIGLIGTIISHDPDFYLAAPIVTDLLLAVVFLGSLFSGRPLVQVMVESMFQGGFPDALRRKPRFKSAWVILTVAWGVLNLSQALLRMILFHAVSHEIYYAVGTVYENVLTSLLIVFSFWFPRWYWERGAV